jgi:hypothetical protein
MDRITAINESLTVFVYGIFGLVPILGCVPAFCAQYRAWRVKREFGTEWNPADAYLTWGAAMACAGLLVSVALVCVAIIILVISYF